MYSTYGLDSADMHVSDPGQDLAGGRPGAYGLWSSNLVVNEFCLSKIVLFLPL